MTSRVVDVWTAPARARAGTDVVGAPGAGTAGWADVLDDAERARAHALPAAVAERFVLGRVLLRAVLGQHLACDPAAVRLDVRCARCGGPHGRVRVAGPLGDAATAPHVSLTRSGPLVAVALSVHVPVGVDVESVAAVSAAPVADVLLSPEELDAHRALATDPGADPAAGAARLARAWVRKEAALKALGTGLAADPTAWALRPPEHRLPGVDALAPGGVAVADLDLGAGLAGAVAVVSAAASGLEVRRHDAGSVLGGRRS